jgi:hypothetical protein
MPFTFSHPAIILPLNYLPKKWFSLTALVAGSMVPDFEYFIRMRSGVMYGHSWPGLFLFDLPLALLLIWIYNSVVRDKMIDHLPLYFNKRLSTFKNSDVPFFKDRWVIIIISTLIGGATHIIWDSFTHWDGYFAMRIPYIMTRVPVGHHHGIPVFAILQLVSSLVGAVAILVVICLLPAGKRTGSGHFIWFWMKVIAIAVPIVIIRFHHGVNRWEIEDVIDTIISGMLIGLIIISAITPAKKVELA